MTFRRRRSFGRPRNPGPPRSLSRRLADYGLAGAILLLLAIVAARLDRVETRRTSGEAVVIDGDTITLNGERIRLRGIDAPEYGQTCEMGGSTYACGRRSREALSALTGSGRIECSGWERDRYRRLLAVCMAGGVDLNRRPGRAAPGCGRGRSNGRATGASSMAEWPRPSTICSPAWSIGCGRSLAFHDRQPVLLSKQQSEDAMKLFDGGRAPNPRRVRIFLAEKGITVPLVPVDMGALEHKKEAISSRNPMMRLPVLELDDGTIITESVAICRYFEELQPRPALFGTGALGKAVVEMWQRRIELNLFAAVAAAFRHIHPAMREWEIPQIPEWGEANKPKAVDFMRILDRELANRAFVAGDAYSIADITGLVAIDFMKPARIAVPEELAHVRRWHETVSNRPSAAA